MDPLGRASFYVMAGALRYVRAGHQIRFALRLALLNLEISNLIRTLK